MSTAADSTSFPAVPAEQHRVEFDAEVLFSNGGSLSAREFRLDIPGSQISDTELGEMLVTHLGLLMVGEVNISRKQIIAEPHKGSRGVESIDQVQRQVLDLAGPDTTVSGRQPTRLELVDLPVTLVRIRGAAGQVIDRVQLMPFAVAGAAVLVDTDAGDGQVRLTAAAAQWLSEQGALVVGGNLEEGAFPLAELAGLTVLSGLVHLDMLPPKSARLHVLPGRPADVYAITPGAQA